MMLCPRCNGTVPALQDACPRCQCDLSLIRSVGELQADVHSRQVEAVALAVRLQEMEDRLAKLSSLITPKVTAEAPQWKIAESPVLKGESVLIDEVASEVKAPVFKLPVDQRPWQIQEHARAFSDSPVISSNTEIQFGQKWLLIGGLVITILAVGYFLKYAFDRNWVGPAGRVALAYMTGLVMWGLGEFLRHRKLEQFGLFLTGGGMAVLYFASFAAFQIYHLYSQPVAFALMALVTALSGALAVFHDTKWLAVLGIIGGFSTPVVLSTGVDNQVALMTYMAILNGGILTIAAWRRWELLNALGMGFTWLLFSAWFVQHYSGGKFWITTVYLNLFFLTYALVPFVYYFVRQSPERVRGFALTIPNTFIAFGYSFNTIRAHFSVERVGVASNGYALLFFALAAYLYFYRRECRDAFVLLIAKGLLFLVLTVPIVFSAHWITVLWAVEGAVFTWAALRLGDSRLRKAATALVLLSLLKFVCFDYVMVFHIQLDVVAFRPDYFARWIERWVATGVVLGGLFVASRWFREMDSPADDRKTSWSEVFQGLFVLLLFVALNLEVAGFFHDMAYGARFAAISVLWALFAAGLMVTGFVKNLSIARRCAIALFAITVVKIFARDVANVATPYRILSFLVVGLVLVAASFLYHRFATRILHRAQSQNRKPDTDLSSENHIDLPPAISQ